MLTYATLDGEVLDLSGLSDEERGFLDLARVVYAHPATTWGGFTDFVHSSQNPLIRVTGGWVTSAVYHHPLYQALRDLEDRVGVRRGELAPVPGDEIDADPFVEATPQEARRAARPGA